MSIYSEMVIWVPLPNLPNLKCRICGLVKKQLDKNDDIVIDSDASLATSTWYCPKGHTNKV